MGRPFGREDGWERCRAAVGSAGYAYADEHALGARNSVGEDRVHGLKDAKTSPSPPTNVNGGIKGGGIDRISMSSELVGFIQGAYMATR
jgi:hypothetical protein